MNDTAVIGLDIEAINQLLTDDPAAAAQHLIDAARKGRPDAQAWLAQLYLDGRGVPRDHEEALYWFQRAAHAGVPMAMNMLGRSYENGWGTPADYSLAAVWYQRAAAHDLDWAVYNMAQMYANGRGVKQDRAEAFRWFTRAVALGHARAMHFLGQFYEYGWEVDVDLPRAFALYRESAEGGDYRGMCSWASVLAETGRPMEAAELVRRAIPFAPSHYLEMLSEQLRVSPWPPLTELAVWVSELCDPSPAPIADSVTPTHKP